MKRVTKVLSKTIDAVKFTCLSLYWEKDEKVVLEENIRSEEDANEASLQMMTQLVFDPENCGEELEPLTIKDYSLLTMRWLNVLLFGIYDTLRFLIKEELGKAIHEDMESLWTKIEKLEERVKELELKA